MIKTIIAGVLAMEQPSHWDTIEGQFTTPLAHVQVVRGTWDRPIDSAGIPRNHHLELNLLPVPGGTRGCFLDQWGPDRFEYVGDLFFLPAYRHVQLKSNCRQQHSVVCDFDPATLENWLDTELEWRDGLLQRVINITNGRIRGLLIRLVEEVRSPGLASATMIELLVSQAAIELSRHLNGVAEEPATGGLSGWRLRRIDQRLAENASQPSLAELAELCDLSVRHLTRAFRNSRGRSLGDYIAERRSEHAKKLIASGMSIKSVAYTLGFSAPSNFTAAFSRVVGETPRQYRLRVCGDGKKYRRRPTH